MKKREHLLNNEIKHSQVRLIGEHQGVYSLSEARDLAGDLDLIEINSKANPPVCVIEDYTKFLYNLKRKEKERRSNQVVSEIKEIKLTPDTGSNDLQHKSKHGVEFLKEGHKLKISLLFKGRSMVFQERGVDKINEFVELVKDYGILEGTPNLNGKMMICFIKPKK
jgi:translation initiation factor IF-3